MVLGILKHTFNENLQYSESVLHSGHPQQDICLNALIKEGSRILITMMAIETKLQVFSE